MTDNDPAAPGHASAGASGSAPGAAPPPPYAAATPPPYDPSPPPYAAATPPPPYAAAPRPPLVRSRSDRKVAGVAGGLGRYTGIDPLVFRIVLVVLAVFGGSGLMVYALGWLFIPDEGEPESEAQRLAQGRGTSTMVAAIVLGVVGLVVFGESVGTGRGFGGLFALVAIGLAAYFVARSGHPSGTGAPAATGWTAPTPPPASGAYGQTPGTAYAAAGGPTATESHGTATTAAGGPTATEPYGTATTEPLAPYPGPGQPPYGTPPPHVPYASSVYLPPPKPPRERSPLGRLTLSAALLVAGVLAGFGALTSTSVPAVVVLAAALTVVGAGLLVATLYGRARWLMVVGLLLAIATAGASIGHGAVADGAGTRTWDPQTVAEVNSPYELGAGDAVLDLRDLDLSTSGPLRVTGHIGAGQLRVLVPDDVPIDVDAHVAIGAIRMPDGTGPDGVDNSARYSDVRGTGGPIVLKLWIGVGELEVRRAAS